MKKLIFILLSILLLSCETEIDIIDESDVTPIVYCLLDPGKEIQTLRLSKSFLNDGDNSTVDSMEMLYFQSKVNIAVEKMKGDMVVDHTEFIPVSIEKDTGNFPGGYHTVYQTKLNIDTNTTYRLVIFIEEENKIVYSYTSIPGEFNIIDPAYPEVRPLHFMRGQSPVFHWTSAQNASIYQLCFDLYYYEIDSLASSLKSVMIPLNTMLFQSLPNQKYSYDINSTQFYIALGKLLDSTSTSTRVFHSIDAFVIAGGEELAIHYQTEMNADPFRIINYTNIQNGLGFFSSIAYSYNRGFKITNQSIDSLAYGKFTRHLNFLDRDGHRKDQ